MSDTVSVEVSNTEGDLFRRHRVEVTLRTADGTVSRATCEEEFVASAAFGPWVEQLGTTLRATTHG